MYLEIVPLAEIQLLETFFSDVKYSQYVPIFFIYLFFISASWMYTYLVGRQKIQG